MYVHILQKRVYWEDIREEKCIKTKALNNTEPHPFPFSSPGTFRIFIHHSINLSIYLLLFCGGVFLVLAASTSRRWSFITAVLATVTSVLAISVCLTASCHLRLGLVKASRIYRMYSNVPKTEHLQSNPSYNQSQSHCLDLGYRFSGSPDADWDVKEQMGWWVISNHPCSPS